ncbi:unnamed protein product [Rotaria socialis]
MAEPINRAFDSITSFRGSSQDNSRDWCDRAEIIFAAYNINDADRLTRIGIKLEDAAFNWYRDNKGPYATWMAFRQVFQRAFPPPERTQNPHLLAEQINQRKQGSDESVHDYYYALDKLCREYDPQMSAIDKTIKLVGGLRDELKEKILPLNVQTPEQFMTQAKNFESSEKVMAHHRRQDRSMELPEPVYAFEANDYSTIAASQPHQYPRQLYNGQNSQQNFKSLHRPQHFVQNRYNQIATNERTLRAVKQQQPSGDFTFPPRQQSGQPSRYYQPENYNEYQKPQHETVNDGTVSNINKNPSTPLIVTLQINNKFVDTMVDTGSAKSIIHINKLYKLIRRPYINYKNCLHRTANNGELRTIGLVNLRIKLKNISTFILAEVAIDLCTGLVLGNDWINQNGIGIITTKQCIRKHQGSYVVNVPFARYEQESYPVYPVYSTCVLPEQQKILPVRVEVKNADTVIFTPSQNLIEKKKLLTPHSLLKVENGMTYITMINANQASQYLNKNMIIGTISFPSSTAISLSLLPTQNIEPHVIHDRKCRVCYEEFTSKKQLFEHLHQNGHYSIREPNGTCQQVPSHVLDKIKDLVEHVTNSHEKKQLESLLIKYGQLFDTSKATTINSTVKHTIEVKNTRPIVQRPYRKTATQEKIISEMCQQFYHDNIIRPSQSPWSSPVVLQKKKDGTWRFCIDYRRLNEVTEKDNYPLPRIQEIFDTLGGAEYFSKLDFHGGYHQVPIDERDKPKTAFVTRDKLWEYNVMPQGIKNGPPTFQRIVNKLLGKLQWSCALSYIDDIIIYSKSMNEHLYHLEQVLSLLQYANFRLNSTKCEFMQRQIKFLGHMINEEGIIPCPDKVIAINDMPVPNSIKAATSFIKMAEYYRNHIPNFSTLAQPLFDLTRKNAKFVWNEKQQNAFMKIKESLMSKPLLQFPDSQLPFIIQVDASNYGIGAVLMQKPRNDEQPVAYMSQKLNKQQQNWNATEKECFAVVSSIRKWNHYVAGRDFIVRTDHHALCWLNRKYNSNPRLNRWRMALQDYTFKIEHVKGNKNCVADCLSRFPVDSPIDDELEQHSKSTQTELLPSIISAVTTRRMNYGEQRFEPTSATTTTTQSNQQLNSLNTVKKITVFTNKQLKFYQQQDNSIKKILENLQRKPFKNEYCIKNDILCRNVNRFNGIISVPVVPREKINDVILAYHNSSMNGGHLGKDKTYYKIRDRYYWPRMYEDITQHVKLCTNCSINKQSRRKPNGHLNPVNPPEGVWDNLAMDFVGPITPSSSTGHKYILVFTDLLSKFVVAKATRDNSALTAAKVLVEEIILKYGCPNQVLTDNGTHFTADLFNNVTSLCGVCHIYTTPYNPQSNGVCERFNASMCDSLASICNKTRTNWDEQLSKTTFAYNSSRHSSTKLTPFELMFGRLCKLPFDLPRQSTTVIEPHQYVKQLDEYLQQAKQAVCTNIKFSQDKSKYHYDAHRTNEIHSIGDFVYVKQLKLNYKLAPKYIGPYQIIQQLNDSIYRLQNPNELNEIINAHTNRIRRCYEPTPKL